MSACRGGKNSRRRSRRTLDQFSGVIVIAPAKFCILRDLLSPSLSLARSPTSERKKHSASRIFKPPPRDAINATSSQLRQCSQFPLSLSPFTHPFALLHRTLQIHLSLPLSHARKYTFVDSRRHHCLSSHDDDSPRLPPRETDCRGVTPVRERSRPVRLRDELASSMTAWLPGVGSSRDRGDRGP